MVLIVIGMLFAVNAKAQLQLKESQLSTQKMQLNAESQKSLSKTGFVRCASVEMDALRKQREGITTTTQQFEDWLAPLMQARKAEIAAQKAAGTFKLVAVEIPIIFHIISSGTGPTNLSAALVQAQIDQLNIDFNNNAGSGSAVAASAQITFIPALVDPSGNLLTEPGIERITTYGSGPFPTSDFDVGGGGLEIKSTGWDYAQYANVWTADISGGILGYAQFPSNSTLPGLSANGGTVINNGVVIGYGTVGSVANPGSAAPYNLGRTLTHEAGHWIGLRHIWGDGDCTVDDFCNDTPNASGSNFGCATGNDSCPADPGTDMVENYMDYSDDSCMNIFTADQVLRIDTVLANADGLSQLPSSTAGQAPAPYVSFENAAQTINEGTDCSYTDVTITLKIGEAPSADATVTVTGSGTATSTLDYEIIGNPITFTTGSIADKSVTLRIYNDGFVEGDEVVTLGLTVNANGGDALVTTAATAQNIVTVADNDVVPNALTSATVFTEDGNSGGLVIIDGDGDGENWGLLNGLGTWGGITDPCMYSASDLTLLGGVGTTTPNNYIITTAFTIPMGATTINLSYALAGYTTTEPYELYFTTDSSSEATILAGTLISSGVAAAGDPGGVTTVNMPLGLAGQTGELAMRHVRTDSNGSLLIWDTVTIIAQTATAVQTAVNSGAATQISLSSTGVIYNVDGVSGNVMVDINNTNGVDYGCVSTSVSRASGTAQMYQVAGAANFVTDKTFTITPATTQASGNATVKFYFTETEIAAWETATGNNRSTLMVIKDNGTTQEVASAAIGAFGTEVTLTATFATGINGTYYFGKSTVLSVADNDFALFNVYPNPSNGNVNITLSSNEDVQVSLFDIRGRKVYANQFNNNAATFSKAIDFKSVAAGVYMLTIESGAKKATKKIVIQ